MKKISIIAMALTLILGLSQCKKEQPTTANEGDSVSITLDIQNNGGTRMDVNTSTGEVAYETGDPKTERLQVLAVLCLPLLKTATKPLALR